MDREGGSRENGGGGGGGGRENGRVREWRGRMKRGSEVGCG